MTRNVGYTSLSSFSWLQIRLIWLRRIALALYHEIHGTFPWSLFDYDEEQLQVLFQFSATPFGWTADDPPTLVEISERTASSFELLPTYMGFTPETYRGRYGVWTGNPGASDYIMGVIQDTLMDGSSERVDAFFAIVQFMRDLGWKHASVVPPTLCSGGIRCPVNPPLLTWGIVPDRLQRLAIGTCDSCSSPSCR